MSEATSQTMPTRETTTATGRRRSSPSPGRHQSADGGDRVAENDTSAVAMTAAEATPPLPTTTTTTTDVAAPPSSHPINAPAASPSSDSKDNAAVNALEHMETLAANIRQTVARAAVRDGQRNAIESQLGDVIGFAVRALKAAADREVALTRDLRHAQDAAAEEARNGAEQERRLQADQRALQQRCTAILDSVADLQKQFADERRGRFEAEQALMQERQERAVETARLQAETQQEGAKEGAKYKAMAERALAKGRSALAAKQQALAEKHRKYTAAVVARLEAEATAKLKEVLKREAHTSALLRRAAQQATADNARFKAELLRLKQLHGDVSTRAQQLQRELFNSQQEQNRLTEALRAEAARARGGKTEMLLRQTVAALEDQLSGLKFQHERDLSEWRTRLQLAEQTSAAHQARQEALVESVRRHAEVERVAQDARHNEALNLVHARIRRVVAAKDATIAKLRSQLPPDS